MDITCFVTSSRAQAFGDNSVYAAQLSRRLLKCRKRLGIQTKNRGKYTKKADVTAESIGRNTEYVRLLLLSSERAWAQAMSMKAAHSTGSKGISGRTRSHIISRMTKAAKTAESLVKALLEQDQSNASSIDILEAFAYAGLMRGAANFEKQCFEPCLTNYSVSRAVYTALSSSSGSSAARTDIYKDLLAETIDPSIQFAAYQLKTPRTVPISIIARRAFPQSNALLVEEINKLDANILRQGDATRRDPGEDVPITLTWRGREVRIEDAQIALAWAACQDAKRKLADKAASSRESLSSKDLAAAYEPILTSAQDAADASKHAIDELRGDSVPPTNPRMQSLLITRTAVNYELISWRIGRNRVLMGRDDGIHEEYVEPSRKRKGNQQPKTAEITINSAIPKGRDVKPRQKIARLKERVGLYDGALQSLEEAMNLPGVPADEQLSAILKASVDYFTALKCLAISRSHALVSQNTSSLTLIHHASSLLTPSLPTLSASPKGALSASTPNILISAQQATFLATVLSHQLLHFRALVHMESLRQQELAAAAKEPDANASQVPLIEKLSVYPVGGKVDFDNIIEYPPKPGYIPVKPVLLDLAWNHIKYPGVDDNVGQQDKGKGVTPTAQRPATRKVGAEDDEQKPAEKKKGWFGFGRK